MKYLSGLLFLIIVAYLALPYIRIYQLDSALNNNNSAALSGLIDLDSVRTIQKQSLERLMARVSNPQTSGMAANLMQKSMKVIGNAAVDSMIDMNWVKDRLQSRGSMTKAMSFAFFESPTRFTIRIGELGDSPIHAQMTLQDWYWRVTAIYE